MAGVLQHLRSSTLNKRPNPASMVDGQVAINYASGSPGMFFKDSNGSLVKVGPVHVGSGAPNAVPASGGTAGNSLGEQWLDTSGGTYVFKIWDGAAWRSEAGEFVNVTGDTMTGALGIIAGSAGSPSLFISGDANTGLYSPGADQVAISTGGTGRLFVDSSGNVGVGTNDTANAFVTLTKQDVSLRLNPVTGAASITAVQTGVAFRDLTIGSNETIFQTASLERMRLDSSGRLGLGTSSPAGLLDVRGEIKAGPINSINGTTLLSDTYTTGGASLGSLCIERSSGAFTLTTNIKQAENATGYISTNTINAGKSALKLNSTGLFYATASASVVPIGDSVSLTDRFVITNAGNVGIGTTSPGSPLTIESNAGNQVKITYPSIASYYLNATSGGDFAINKDGTERARIDSSGRLLVGTSSTSSEAKLLVQGGSTGSGAALHLQRNVTTASAGSTIGYLRFANSADNAGATIVAEGDGTWTAGTSHPTRLTFSTTADGASSPTERMRIDSSGRLLVGTSTAAPGMPSVGGCIGLAGGSSGGRKIDLYQDPNAHMGLGVDIGGGPYEHSIYFPTGPSGEGTLRIGSINHTSPGTWSERMRIAADGTVYINRTSAISGFGSYLNISHAGGASYGIMLQNNSTNISNAVTFINASNVEVGRIEVTSSATSYITSSDYRLKENIYPLTGAIDRVNQLKAHRFNFLAAPDKIVDGFLAHEAQEIVPECATGTKDEVDDDGNPVYQGIDQSKLVPLLTAALQEALQKIEDLEGRLTAAGI
jgi:hypothetical protein